MPFLWTPFHAGLQAEADCLGYAAIRMRKAALPANPVPLHVASLCAQQDTQLAYLQANSKQVNWAMVLGFLFPFE